MRTDHQGEDAQHTGMETWNRLMNLRGKGEEEMVGRYLPVHKILYTYWRPGALIHALVGSLSLASGNQAENSSPTSLEGVPDCERSQAMPRTPLVHESVHQASSRVRKSKVL